MSSTPTLDAAGLSSAACDESSLVATVGPFAHVSADLAQADALRRDPGPLPGRELPASFLKHADDHSVCGFAAVLQAIAASGKPISAYREWGVIGAPRYPGRILGGAAMAKFFDQGVRGISPHIIPQNSLHSLSGVISVGLEMGGPNFGAGGGSAALADGFLAAFTLLAEGRVPGLWLVTTEWDREPLPQKNGRVVAEGACHAVALALKPADASATGLCLTFCPPSPDAAAPLASSAESDDEAPSVMTLAAALSRRQRAAHGAALWRFRLDWGAEIVLTKKHSS